MKVGIIGLGIMGKPMALNILKAGHELVVNDLNKEAMNTVIAAGATGAASPKAVAETSDVVITMLPNGPQVKEVVLGPNGVLEGAHDGLVLIDMTSIAPGVSREVNEAVSAKGVKMLDAPVSGGEPGAIAGTLSIMVGGDKDVFEAHEELLKSMGKTITLVGPIGAGNTAKLANQAIVAVNIAVLAEALTMSQKAGVEPEAVFHAIRGGLAGSAVMEQKADKMLTQDFAPGFRINLHIKDLNNVLDTARATESYMPLTAAVREMMTGLAADGHATDDHCALLRIYQQLGQVVLGNTDNGATNE